MNEMPANINPNWEGPTEKLEMTMFGFGPATKPKIPITQANTALRPHFLSFLRKLEFF